MSFRTLQVLQFYNMWTTSVFIRISSVVALHSQATGTGVITDDGVTLTFATNHPPSEEVQGQPPLSSVSTDISEDLLLYLNRTLYINNHISADILKDARNYPDIYIFNGIDKSELIGWAKLHILIFNSSRIVGAGWIRHKTAIIILDEPSHYQEICKLVEGSTPVHLLQYDRSLNHNMRWIWSKGNPERLEGFIHSRKDKPMELGGNELFEMVVQTHHEHKHPILIFGSSEPENSLFLSHVAAKLGNTDSETEVLLAPTFEEAVALNRSSSRTDLLVENFHPANLDDLTRKLNITLAQHRSRAQTENAIILVGRLGQIMDPARLWTTMLKLKPYYKADLRLHLDYYSVCCDWTTYHQLATNSKFNLLPYEIKPMGREDQVEFLGRFWSRGKEADLGRLGEFAQHCLNVLSLSMQTGGGDLADPALQSVLLAEVYEEEAIEYAQCQIGESDIGNVKGSPNITINSILDIYDRLVEKRIEKYERSFNNGTVSLDSKDVWDMHTQLALNFLFPDKFDDLKQSSEPIDMGELMKIGLLMGPSSNTTRGSPRFIYPTLAEYFAVRGVMYGLRRELDYGGNHVHDFLFEWLLETKKAPCPNYNASEFTHHTMVHFLSEILPELPTLLWDDPELTFPSPEAMHTIAQACAMADAFRVLEFLDDMGGFANETFNSQFVFLAIARSGIDLVKFAISKLELYHGFDEETKEKALRMAAHRGNLPILEWLLTEKGLLELVKGEKIKWLLRDCVEQSMHDRDPDIDERIQVARRLVGINPQLLEPKLWGRTKARPYSSVHPRLLVELIRLGADVLYRDPNFNETILHLDPGRNYLTKEEYHSLVVSIPKDKLKQLVNLKNYNGETALMNLIKSMDPLPETLELFKEAGANYGEYLIPIICVDLKRLPSTLRKLIECGANFTWETSWEGETLLRFASQYGNLEAVKILVDEHGMDVNQEDKHGRTPLDLLIKRVERWHRGGMRFETGVALIERGGVAKSLESVESTRDLLRDSVDRDELDTVRLLIHLGVDMNQVVDSKGNTPLHECLSKSHWMYPYIIDPSLVKLLLDANADPNLINTDGKTAIHLGFENENLDMDTFQLLYSNENVSWTENLADVAMISLIKLEKGDEFTPIARRLDGLGALTNFTDRNGNTMLGVAARYANDKAMQYLVGEKEMDVNQVSNLCDPKTPLHQAARVRNKDASLRIIKYLVDHGANVYWRDREGDTFLHSYMAEYDKPSPSQFHSIVEYLIGKGHADLFDMVGGYFGEYTTPYQFSLQYVIPEVRTLDLLRANGVGEGE